MQMPVGHPASGSAVCCDNFVWTFVPGIVPALLTSLYRFYADAACSVSNSYPLKSTFITSEMKLRRHA
jgi:hypothetical protein